MSEFYESRYGQYVEEFDRLFPDEETCVETVLQLKWRDGFRCDRCGHDAAYRIQTRRLPLFECAGCGRQASLTSGTFLHKSSTPLRKWLFAMFCVARKEASIHASALAYLLRVTYKTALSMLRKIRACISAMDRDVRLEGRVQGKHILFMNDLLLREERVAKEQSAVVARSVSEETGESYYKIKLLSRRKPARQPLSEEDRETFERQYCEDGIRQVEWDARYQAKWNHAFRLESVLPAADEKDPERVSIGLAMAARRAFEWMNRTFHGIGPKYAALYFDEFCFRLNGLVRGIRSEDLWELLLGNMTSVPRYQQATA